MGSGGRPLEITIDQLTAPFEGENTCSSSAWGIDAVMSGGGASIQVAVRTRHFDAKHRAKAEGAPVTKLGVVIQYNDGSDGSEQGAQVVIPTQWGQRGHEKPFAFRYAFWGANNHDKFRFSPETHAQFDEATDKNLVDGMVADRENINVDQARFYELVGSKILADLLDGKPVVIFAYGLSGSGKTYTTFGVDNAELQSSWFFQDNPESEFASQWGLFPRLAWDVFQLKKKEPRYKFRMQYLQNVVDDVFDLIGGGTADKNSMTPERKPPHFYEHAWATEVEMETFDDLLTHFRAAASRKQVSPTQFNPSSTRGHVVVIFKIVTPEGREGRFYVCDLAGSEKAAEVKHYTYTFDADGDVAESHPTPGAEGLRQTEILVKQGIKINQSLTEMSSIFKKLKKDIQHGKTPSIVGESYWINKFLKKSLLASSVWLLCAIRPELGYSPDPEASNKADIDHQYEMFTYNTLKFGQNASAIKTRVVKIENSAANGKVAQAERSRDDAVRAKEDAEKRIAELEAVLAQSLSGGGGAALSLEALGHAGIHVELSEQQLAAAREGRFFISFVCSFFFCFVCSLFFWLLYSCCLAAREGAKAKKAHAEVERERELERERAAQIAAHEKAKREEQERRTREMYSARGLRYLGFNSAEAETTLDVIHLIDIRQNSFETRRSIFSLGEAKLPVIVAAREIPGAGAGAGSAAAHDDGTASLVRPFALNLQQRQCKFERTVSLDALKACGGGGEADVLAAPSALRRSTCTESMKELGLSPTGITLFAMDGHTTINGQLVIEGAPVPIYPNDRIAFGDSCFLVRVPDHLDDPFRVPGFNAADPRPIGTDVKWRIGEGAFSDEDMVYEAEAGMHAARNVESSSHHAEASEGRLLRTLATAKQLCAMVGRPEMEFVSESMIDPLTGRLHAGVVVRCPVDLLKNDAEDLTRLDIHQLADRAFSCFDLDDSNLVECTRFVEFWTDASDAHAHARDVVMVDNEELEEQMLDPENVRAALPKPNDDGMISRVAWEEYFVDEHESATTSLSRSWIIHRLRAYIDVFREEKRELVKKSGHESVRDLLSRGGHSGFFFQVKDMMQRRVSMSPVAGTEPTSEAKAGVLADAVGTLAAGANGSDGRTPTRYGERSHKWKESTVNLMEEARHVQMYDIFLDETSFIGAFNKLKATYQRVHEAIATKAKLRISMEDDPISAFFSLSTCMGTAQCAWDHLAKGLPSPPGAAAKPVQFVDFRGRVAGEACIEWHHKSRSLDPATAASELTEDDEAYTMMLGGATAEHVQGTEFFHTHGWELSISMNNVRNLRNRVSRAWFEYEVAYDVIHSNAFDAADAMMDSTVNPPLSHRMDHSQECVFCTAHAHRGADCPLTLPPLRARPARSLSYTFLSGSAATAS